MINKVSLIKNTNFISKPTFKSQVGSSSPETQEKTKTPETIANYDISTITIAKKFNIKPLVPTVFLPEYTDTIKGDRIYTSEGKLHSIVDEDETTKTIYITNKENESLFDSIITTDKETGKKIRSQENYIKDGKYNEITVYAYSKDSGELEADTIYYDGELYSATKYTKTPNKEETITYNYKDKDYAWYRYSPNEKKESCIRMTKDMKFVDFSENKRIKDKEIEVEARFYNGGLISMSEEKRTVVPNLLGKEPLNDKDLKPATNFNLEAIKPDFEGKKTYFSNGAIESITISDGTAFFEPDGKLHKLIAPSKEIEIDKNGNKKITEKFDNDTTKTTTYFKSNTVLIEFENSNIYKELKLNSDLKPIHYSEANKNEDSKFSYWYNEQGILETAYNF